MNKYKILNRSMGKYRCVTLTDPKGGFDDCLAGELGEIWPDGTSGSYKAFFVVNRKYEKIISFLSKDLNKWVLKLKVDPNPHNQLLWANNPNSRLD